MRIVFMGTPHFAVPSLEKLIDDRHDVAAVVTQPDRKSGRGHKVLPPPVKECAQRHGIRVVQFARIKDEGVAAIKALAPDIIVTAAFGQILSKEILDIPPMGCINVHASLLPKYRGAAPIQWAIINGESRSGVTIMYMDEGLDTGDMIASTIVSIGNDMTGGMLYELLSEKGADLLMDVLHNIENGTAIRTPQKNEDSSYYPPLSKELGAIDWHRSACDIRNLIRALDPVMGAYGTIGGQAVKIWQATVMPGSAAPGQIVCAEQKDGFVIGTGDGLLRVDMMQAAGSRRMPPSDFFAGRRLPGERFD